MVLNSVESWQCVGHVAVYCPEDSYFGCMLPGEFHIFFINLLISEKSMYRTAMG